MFIGYFVIFAPDYFVSFRNNAAYNLPPRLPTRQSGYQNIGEIWHPVFIIPFHWLSLSETISMALYLFECFYVCLGTCLLLNSFFVRAFLPLFGLPSLYPSAHRSGRHSVSDQSYRHHMSFHHRYQVIWHTLTITTLHFVDRMRYKEVTESHEYGVGSYAVIHDSSHATSRYPSQSTSTFNYQSYIQLKLITLYDDFNFKLYPLLMNFNWCFYNNRALYGPVSGTPPCLRSWYIFPHGRRLSRSR